MITTPPDIPKGLIDETFELLEKNLELYKVYLGSEHLGEDYAAPKLVVVPEQDGLLRAKAEEAKVDLGEQTLSVGVTPLARRSLGLSVYCYGRGPGYSETEALWQAVVSVLSKAGIQWNPETAVVRYSTDIPQAHTHRVAVFTFETPAVTFDAPQFVTIEKIVSDCLDEPVSLSFNASASSDFTAILAAEPEAPSYSVYRLFITAGEGRWFDGVAVAEWTLHSDTPYTVTGSSASTEFYEAANAFDGNETSAWRSSNYQQAAQFLQLELEQALAITGYSLSVSASSNSQRPTSWRLEALDESGLWTVLDEQSGVTWPTLTQSFEIGVL